MYQRELTIGTKCLGNIFICEIHTQEIELIRYYTLLERWMLLIQLESIECDKEQIILFKTIDAKQL